MITVGVVIVAMQCRPSCSAGSVAVGVVLPACRGRVIPEEWNSHKPDCLNSADANVVIK